MVPGCRAEQCYVGVRWRSVGPRGVRNRSKPVAQIAPVSFAFDAKGAVGGVRAVAGAAAGSSRRGDMYALAPGVLSS